MTVYAITTLAAGFLADDSPVTNHDLHANANAIQFVSLLVGTVLPLLAGLISKATWPRVYRSMTLLALSAVSGFLTEWLNSSNFDLWQAIFTTMATFLVGVGTYYGIWKDTAIANKALAVGSNRNEGGYAQTINMTLIALALASLALAAFSLYHLML